MDGREDNSKNKDLETGRVQGEKAVCERKKLYIKVEEHLSDDMVHAKAIEVYQANLQTVASLQKTAYF